MIDFVGIPQLLRLALQVAMATMHFHIAQTGLESLFLPLGCPNEQLEIVRRCMVGTIRCQCIWYPNFRVICDTVHPWGIP